MISLAPNSLPFFVLGSTEGVQQYILPPSDDAISDGIYIPGGLPIGTNTHTVAYVSLCEKQPHDYPLHPPIQVGTNGIVSLGEQFNFYNPQPFPTDNFYIHTSHVMAPFWADVDTRLAGSVSYETHHRGSNAESNAVLERVSGFIAAQTNTNFTASWMLLAQWDRVHPYPHGSSANSQTSGPYQDFLNSVSVPIG